MLGILQRAIDANLLEPRVSAELKRRLAAGEYDPE